jgi:hypothetical protein
MSAPELRLKTIKLPQDVFPPSLVTMVEMLSAKMPTAILLAVAIWTSWKDLPLAPVSVSQKFSVVPLILLEMEFATLLAIMLSISGTVAIVVLQSVRLQHKSTRTLLAVTLETLFATGMITQTFISF